ncbi:MULTISPECIES: DUF1853 family protein [unclassified Janthinobacterium]|uniref:DUF1853 family protein n=1 Tax=unclassified Janthinobacterium TaxID=2610881 RepID=UPI001616C89A|nr:MULTISPECIES: DUF1853 family protein [unclassified Janthinobacterium]MBB5366941.1 hypothetical protein [Janthinobacterium sp. K2C7]MBB5380581.1 hypothetical protein [Janthinobacterium sp. K2Li3]MBB5385323.1 hypothetical protein [Janthinobacterium sp. K2E3]
MPGAADRFQQGFESRWGHLTHPHVRALAWLLDSPDLLDPASPHWSGRIASLGPLTPAVASWLAALQDDHSPLATALGPKFYSRLGLYAEKLLAFYFEQHGLLQVHGLQVQVNRNDTVGEFDFLLHDGNALLHWEFATKFYLLEGRPDPGIFNHLIGPNLADTLGLKMRKIIDKQLALSRHPAALSLLTQPVASAQALVKGWLFYEHGEVSPMDGISSEHGHGFWCTAAQLPQDQRYVILPKLQWLAPYKGLEEEVFDAAALRKHLAELPQPVLVAAVEHIDGWEVEQSRGFIVPENWTAQAAARRLAGTLPD